MEKGKRRRIKKKMISNYTTSLATYLYERIDEHQANKEVRRTHPMAWPTGLYFTCHHLAKWIEEHDKSETI